MSNTPEQPAQAGQVQRLVGRPEPIRCAGCDLPNGCPEYCWCDVPSEEAARQMGATGGPAHEGERRAFEAWMRGHCWALCATWDGKSYRSDAEQGGDVDPRAMRTRQLWAAWRDRAALAKALPPNAKLTGEAGGNT